MPGVEGRRPFVVVGAGAAGLAAARALTGAGERVVVVEAGATPGGRWGTDAVDGDLLDSGAQFFTVRSEVFAGEVSRWLAEGAAREWCRGFGEPDGHPRYVAGGGMRALARRLAAGLDVRTDVRVRAVVPSAGGWQLRWERSADRLPADGWETSGGGADEEVIEAAGVVLTPPAPVAAGLLRAGGAPMTEDAEQALDAIAYHPTLAVLAVLDRPSAVPPPGAVQLDAGPFTWVADNAAKGLSAGPALTLHTSGEVSRALWGRPDDVVVAELLDRAEPWVAGARVTAVRLVRWPHARPVRLHPARCLVAVDGPAPVVVAGDAYGEARVEGAWLSGLVAAARVRGLAPVVADPSAR